MSKKKAPARGPALCESVRERAGDAPSSGVLSTLIPGIRRVTPAHGDTTIVEKRVVYNADMKHISAHIKSAAGRQRQTERGELMKYFCQKLNAARMRDGLGAISMGRMGKLLQAIPTKDLYYLRRVCDDAQNFSKKFWYELNPEKYDKKQKPKA